MTHSRHWQDTQQLQPRDESTPAGDAGPTQAADSRLEAPDAAGFPNTELPARDGLDSRWWSEAADGQCSEEAAQFAASQPAALSIV